MQGGDTCTYFPATFPHCSGLVLSFLGRSRILLYSSLFDIWNLETFQLSLPGWFLSNPAFTFLFSCQDFLHDTVRLPPVNLFNPLLFHFCSAGEISTFHFSRSLTRTFVQPSFTTQAISLALHFQVKAQSLKLNILHCL